MADDAERLIVLLEARIRDFEKNLQKASGTAERNYSRMRKDSKSATAAMEADMVRSTNRINQALAASSAKIGAYGKAAIGGFVGGFVAGGIAGIVSQIGQVANSIARVGDEAKRAGVSVQAFQEWKFVAEQNRIGIDQMTDGLKELNLRADEFVQTGKGSAAEAFMRLGYSAEELQKKLKNPSELLLEIIDRLGKMDKAAQIRISDELFGGSAGERFVELLDQGADGIRRTIDRAHELGLVMDDEMIAKAAELDRRFNQIANTVGTALKSAIVSAADSLVDFINGFRAFENQRSSALEAQVNDIMRQRAVLVEELKKLQSGSDLSDNARDLGFGPATETAKQQIAEVQAAIDALTARENEIIGILSDRTSEQLPKTGDRTWTPPKPPLGGFGGAASRDKAAQQAEREAEAVRRLIAELQHELAMIGQTDLERDKANALRQAGAAATDEQRQQIEQLVESIHREAEALREAEDAARARNEVLASSAEMGINAMMSIADGSKSAEEAIKDLTKRLIAMLVQLLIIEPLMKSIGGGGFGLGGGAPILNSGGGFGAVVGYSSGTPNTGGQKGQPRGIVHGQEAVIPLPSGGKVPVQLQGGGAAAPSVTVNVQNNSNAQVDVGQPQKGADGGLSIDVIINEIEGKTESSIRNGRLGRAIGQTFGLQRRTR